MVFKDAFCKKFKLLADRFSSFAKRRKLVEKMIHQKKNRKSKIVKYGQSYSNGHLPYHCSFITKRELSCMM